MSTCRVGRQGLIPNPQPRNIIHMAIGVGRPNGSCLSGSPPAQLAYCQEFCHMPTGSSQTYTSWLKKISNIMKLSGLSLLSLALILTQASQRSYPARLISMVRVTKHSTGRFHISSRSKLQITNFFHNTVMFYFYILTAIP